MEGEAEIAKTLVKLGASVGYLNRQKKTAVDAAKEKFHHDLAAWLQAEGAEAAHCPRHPPDPKNAFFFNLRSPGGHGAGGGAARRS